MNSQGRAWITEETDEYGNTDLVMNFCKEFMDELGWEVGDELAWEQKGEGWVIRKIREEEPYLNI